MTEHPFIQMYYYFVFLGCSSFAGMILIGFITALWGKDSAVSKVVLVMLMIAFLISIVVIITPYQALQIIYQRFF